MTLSAQEFIRRFLIHVLPDGFQRIRYYGFLSNRHREEKLAICRQLLAMPPAVREKASGELLSDGGYEARSEKLTGVHCGNAPSAVKAEWLPLKFLLRHFRNPSTRRDDFS